ncbi:hypothetical protein [Candidatus Oscillochloris fontis]|uniref:hypothetical protein n=1 Tax=Candidatus Oscillochloris fontis TaxID=2496868 RepID=UPI00101C31DF|nr:hypothetical protein [Candidatus Oscillochloris fontis]
MLLRLWLDAPTFGGLLRDRRAWLKVGIFGVMGALSSALYLNGFHAIAGHASLRAHSLSEFVGWFIRAMTYPLLESSQLHTVLLSLAQWGVIIGALVLYFIQRHDPVTRRKLVLLVSLLLLVLANAGLTAYGRGGHPEIASRYITLLLWVSALFVVTTSDIMRFVAQRRGWVAHGALALVALIFASIVAIHTLDYTRALADLPVRRAERMAQATTTINYLLDPTAPIRGPMPTIKPLFDEVLNDPAQRSLLPAWILDPTQVLPATSFGAAWGFRGVRSATDNRASWGSWSDDLLATGRIESAPFKITQPYLIVNITGYPNRSGNRLILETLDGSGDWLRYNDSNPGLAWREWHVDVSAFMGRYVRIVAVDNSTDAQGWLGFGSVRFVSPTVRIMDALIGNLEWLVGGTLILIMTAAFVVSQTPPDLRSRPVAAVTLLAVAGLIIYCTQTPPASQTFFSLQPQRLTQEPFAMLRALPASFVDTSAIKRVPDGLFMHPNAGLVVGPFEARTPLCLTTQAQIDPAAPQTPEHDGVQFVAYVLVDNLVLAQAQATAMLGHPAEMRLELPTNQPFTISLQTQMRSNSAYDWAIWHQPQIAPCSP